MVSHSVAQKPVGSGAGEWGSSTFPLSPSRCASAEAPSPGPSASAGGGVSTDSWLARREAETVSACWGVGGAAALPGSAAPAGGGRDGKAAATDSWAAGMAPGKSSGAGSGKASVWGRSGWPDGGGKGTGVDVSIPGAGCCGWAEGRPMGRRSVNSAELSLGAPSAVVAPRGLGRVIGCCGCRTGRPVGRRSVNSADPARGVADPGAPACVLARGCRGLGRGGPIRSFSVTAMVSIPAVTTETTGARPTLGGVLAGAVESALAAGAAAAVPSGTAAAGGGGVCEGGAGTGSLLGGGSETAAESGWGSGVGVGDCVGGGRGMDMPAGRGRSLGRPCFSVMQLSAFLSVRGTPKIT